jgi:predicted DCC family thiol-disulfide oxidoreductase YuxK
MTNAMPSTPPVETTAPESKSGELPTVFQRPQADVVIYDGHCSFCRGQVERVNRWDTPGRLAYLSLHDPEVARRYPDLDHDALMQQMVLVDRQGHRHWGAAAFRYLSARLPRLWLLAPLLHIPGSLGLWQAMYRQVAKRRYQFGRTDACDSGSCRLP